MRIFMLFTTFDKMKLIVVFLSCASPEQKGNYDEAERLCKEAKKLAARYKDKESALRAEECIVKSNQMKSEDADLDKRINKGTRSSSSG